MITDEIHEAVAKATSEDIRTIVWHGFVLLELTADSNSSGEPAPAGSDEIDWDDVDLERYLAMCG